jgi:hypothetical protein
VTQRAAETFYKVPGITTNKRKGKHSLRQVNFLSFHLKNIFVKCIILTNDLGFPIDTFDLKCIIKVYLGAKGAISEQSARQ